jgi:hypothetical protein
MRRRTARRWMRPSLAAISNWLCVLPVSDMCAHRISGHSSVTTSCSRRISRARSILPILPSSRQSWDLWLESPRTQTHLLWIATNHGEHDGLLVQSEPVDELADEDEPPRLSPDLLQQSLDALPGQQIAMIAACHAGIFLPLASERRVVLASCGAGSAYRASRFTEPPCSPFLCDMLSHWAGVNFPNYEPPARRSIAEAFHELQPKFPGCESRGEARWPG